MNAFLVKPKSKSGDPTRRLNTETIIKEQIQKVQIKIQGPGEPWATTNLLLFNLEIFFMTLS